MHKIKIEIDEQEVLFDNVSTIVPQIVTEYYHNTTSLNGRKYQDVRYKKTDYQVLFYDGLDKSKYEDLKQFIRDNRGLPIKCWFPNEKSYLHATYYLTIQDERFKGYLGNGKYYKTGLLVLFEKETADVK